MRERRKFVRYPEQLYMRLFVSDIEAAPSKMTNFESVTLDFGQGGFRIESPLELAKGTVVGFETGDDVSTLNFSGVGEVKWCRPSPRSGYFEFGLATNVERDA